MEDCLTLAVPNFKGAHYLPHTLASLQRNRPFVRWYLQDSCSPDDSVAIAEKMAGPQDRIVVEKDKGQSDGLNRAFAAMGGDPVGFLNSDDCLKDGAAETIVTVFRENPDVDILVGGIEWIDGAGNVLGHHKGEISTLPQMLSIYDYWWNKKQWVQPEVFFRRRVWEKTGLFNTGMNLAFDYEYWVRALQCGFRVKHVDQVFTQFRLHDQQKSKAAEQAAAEIRAVVRRALESPECLGWKDKATLEAMLDYDEYQGSAEPKEGFLPALVKNPNWLLSEAVRGRITDSIRQRMFRR